jgi:hypothetical protein
MGHCISRVVAAALSVAFVATAVPGLDLGPNRLASRRGGSGRSGDLPSDADGPGVVGLQAERAENADARGECGPPPPLRATLRPRSENQLILFIHIVASFAFSCPRPALSCAY